MAVQGARTATTDNSILSKFTENLIWFHLLASHATYLCDMSCCVSPWRQNSFMAFDRGVIIGSGYMLGPPLESSFKVLYHRLTFSMSSILSFFRSHGIRNTCITRNVQTSDFIRCGAGPLDWRSCTCNNSIGWFTTCSAWSLNMERVMHICNI